MSPMSMKLRLLGTTSIDGNLPWHEYTEDDNSVDKAMDVLERDHYGLKDKKIVEYLAVKSLLKEGEGKGTILCLVGPPGVGKTSIAHSLADSMGRKFVRISLGGVRDERNSRS